MGKMVGISLMGFGSVIPMIGFKWEVKGGYFFFRFGNMEYFSYLWYK
jgi:hypothetical protein